MDAAERILIVKRLTAAFGAAVDMTPEPAQPLHVLLPTLELPTPWTPSSARALTIWSGWPAERPLFLVDENVVGESGEPPRSNSLVYHLGEPWRQFSFAFPWEGDEPVRAIQMWVSRFVVERT